MLNNTTLNTPNCYASSLIVIYKLQPLTFLLLIVGIPANALLLNAIRKKSKETSAFRYQLVIILNDELLLLNELVSIIFLFAAKRTYATNQYGTFPVIEFSRNISWFYNCLNTPLFNIYFTAVPFLLLNVCIERNICVYKPFFFMSQTQARRRLLMFLCVFDYVIAIGTNLYQVFGYYVSVGCPDVNDESCQLMAIANYTNEYIDPVCNLARTYLTMASLCAIYVLNVTFFVKYYRWTTKRVARLNVSSNATNNKMLAIMLAAQTIIMSTSQIVVLVKVHFENFGVYSYEDSSKDHCVVNQLQAALQVLFYLGPATNLFVYGMMSTDFGRFVYNMVLFQLMAIRKKAKFFWMNGSQSSLECCDNGDTSVTEF